MKLNWIGTSVSRIMLLREERSPLVVSSFLQEKCTPLENGDEAWQRIAPRIYRDRNTCVVASPRFAIVYVLNVRNTLTAKLYFKLLDFCR